MEAYRYQQFAYLIVPIVLGMEFFFYAKHEKAMHKEPALGFYVFDALGFIFMALLPAVFIFTIWAKTTAFFGKQDIQIDKLDRYGVLFFFFGAWWQIHLFAALRARRMRRRKTEREGSGHSYLWAPFLVLGIYVSFLILWVAPFGIKWFSVAWFLFVFGIMHFIKAGIKTIERTMWFLSAIIFFGMNIVFIWLESVV